MIDLETLGKGSHAAIWTIGAVKFDPNFAAQSAEYLIMQTQRFHVRISIDSSFRVGRADASTVEWWMQSSQDIARHRIFEEMGAIDIVEALDGFKQWFGDDKPVWGNGATFDNVILSNAFHTCNIERPWSFRNDRCYRTLKSLAPELKSIDVGVAHGALDDALAQAWHLQQIVKHLDLTL
jgi:hypothetical protein